MGPLWQALRQEGATACGMRALETVRIEEGFPVIGLDITEKTLPQEVGAEREGHLASPRAAIWDRKSSPASTVAGPSTSSSRAFVSQTADVPPSGGELTHGGQPAGQITSAAYSPGFGASVALAYVRRQFHEPGTVLDSAWGTATVVELPMR